MSRNFWTLLTLPTTCCLLTASASVCAKGKLTPQPHAAISSSRFTPTERTDLAGLPAPKTAKRELFTSLADKGGEVPALPEHPSDVSALGRWFFARQTTSNNPSIIYPLLYENLLIAQGLLASPNLERRRFGLVVARYSAMAARLNCQDYAVDARICEAFLIPHLDIAYPENGHTVSRRQILEDTYNAYAGTGDTAHLIETLQFLLRYADSPDTKNWTRIMLSQAYERARNYNQAIAYLQTTDPVDQAWLARLKQEQAENKTAIPAVSLERSY